MHPSCTSQELFQTYRALEMNERSMEGSKGAGQVTALVLWKIFDPSTPSIGALIEQDVAMIRVA